ncbi:MAG: TIGR02206 family membrane protein [Chloroflexota bacterium]
MLEQFFTFSYDGPPFVLFSAIHLTSIALVLLSCFAVVAGIRRDRSSGVIEAVRHGLAIFSLLNLIAWQWWNYAVGIWSVAYTLPLHLCTFANFLCAVLLWTKNYRLFEVLYFWAMAGVTQALITPDIGRFGFPHFVFIIFFTSHGVTQVAVVFMMMAYGYRPYWSSVVRATIATLGLLVIAGVANWLTGGNYMFVARTPEFSSLIDHLGPWPWYIFSMVGLGVVAFVIVYLPFAIRDWYVSTRRQSSVQVQ